MSEPLLKVEGLKKYFPIRGGLFSGKLGEVKAVQDVTFDLEKGETLGLVGESGCGKSTLGRAIMRLEEPTAGDVIFEGRSLIHCSNRELFALRPNLQMIFQDPYSSLNPRMTIGEIIREPLEIHRIGARDDRTERTAELLESVGLRAEMAGRYPHEFSGGQRQRVGIARTLALKPKLIIADEPLSALDVSVQAQVINLMVSLQKSLGLTYIFISHDLSVVEYISDRIAVMYLGRIVEIGPKRTVFDRPAHPYTRALIEAVPVADPRHRREAAPIRGETPSAVNPPSGCAFHPRCPLAVDRCASQLPTLEPVAGAGEDDSRRLVACLRKDEI